ncbi:MAG TPA: methyltransferase domain-containing protein [Abditibacteriaceae bacterium]|nr:methyltransferase domain-containing protein [Abditibacteriaceae bacterium]
MTKFDISQAQRLDSADRMAWNNPAKIIAAVDIPPGARVAEIGCGSGWFTFELEKAVRPRGMVYALDMQPAMLQILRARRENWERILTLPCDENEFQLDNNEVDIVFHANTLHECSEPEKHLREAHRVLKEQGRLIVIEWHWADEESQPGPPNTERLEVDTVQQLVEAAGFQVSDVTDAGPYHYAVQAVKF